MPKSKVELFQIVDNIWDTWFISCPNRYHLDNSTYGTSLNPYISKAFSIEPVRVVLSQCF